VSSAGSPLHTDPADACDLTAMLWSVAAPTLGAMCGVTPKTASCCGRQKRRVKQLINHAMVRRKPWIREALPTSAPPNETGLASDGVTDLEWITDNGLTAAHYSARKPIFDAVGISRDLTRLRHPRGAAKPGTVNSSTTTTPASAAPRRVTGGSWTGSCGYVQVRTRIIGYGQLAKEGYHHLGAPSFVSGCDHRLWCTLVSTFGTFTLGWV
jgi:hypothetical protein